MFIKVRRKVKLLKLHAIIYFFFKISRNLFSFIIFALIFANMPAQPIFIESPDSTNLDLEIIPFSSGRFVNAIQSNKAFTHAMQLVREETTSSFVLNLLPNGTATLCRGWRYLFFNNGPNINASEHIREQLGYSGSWAKNNEWIEVSLKLDQEVCQTVQEYTQLVPNHSNKWSLRCLPILIKNHSTLTNPVLICQLDQFNDTFGEGLPHSIADILFEGRWIILGTTNGILMKIDEDKMNNSNQSGVTSINIAPSALKENAWELSF